MDESLPGSNWNEWLGRYGNWAIPEDREDEDSQDMLVMMQTMLSVDSCKANELTNYVRVMSLICEEENEAIKENKPPTNPARAKQQQRI
jgi:hypothetical protein